MEAAVPVFEIDAVEDSLLQRHIDILVLTPEKLDLLTKTRHPAVADLSLVVADEAHNLQSGERGARLELLLATLKRERANTRFLLLTPFIPNASVISQWLGDDVDTSIKVDWKPSERITAAISWEKPRMQPYRVMFTTLPSATNVDVVKEQTYLLGLSDSTEPRSVGRISISAIERLANRGTVLALCRTRTDAEERAESLKSRLPLRSSTSVLRSAVIDYAKSELGTEHILPELLEHGVTYHHAALSHDLRFLIETLVDAGEISVVCGTSTLAQGVNCRLPAGWDHLDVSASSIA